MQLNSHSNPCSTYDVLFRAQVHIAHACNHYFIRVNDTNDYSHPNEQLILSDKNNYIRPKRPSPKPRSGQGCIKRQPWTGFRFMGALSVMYLKDSF